jgi:hypothetical protein
MRKGILLFAAAAIAVLLAVPVGASGYADIAGSYAEEAILALTDSGVVNGYDEGVTFAPKDSFKAVDLDIALARLTGKPEPKWTRSPEITREAAAKAVAEAFGLEPVAEPKSKYGDDAEIVEEYRPYVYALKEAGYQQGDGTDYMPKVAFTREAIMQTLYNALGSAPDAIVDADAKGKTYAGSAVIRKSGVTLADSTVKGDLIVGQGVGDGEVTLDGVNVPGRLVVFGGGSDSVIIKGASKIAVAVINKRDGEPVRLKVEGSAASVAKCEIKDGSRAIVVGNVLELRVEANAEVTLPDGFKGRIEIDGEGVKVLDGDGKDITAEVTKATEAQPGSSGGGGGGGGGGYSPTPTPGTDEPGNPKEVVVTTAEEYIAATNDRNVTQITVNGNIRIREYGDFLYTNAFIVIPASSSLMLPSESNFQNYKVYAGGVFGTIVMSAFDEDEDRIIIGNGGNLFEIHSGFVQGIVNSETFRSEVTLSGDITVKTQNYSSSYNIENLLTVETDSNVTAGALAVPNGATLINKGTVHILESFEVGATATVEYGTFTFDFAAQVRFGNGATVPQTFGGVTAGGQYLWDGAAWIAKHEWIDEHDVFVMINSITEGQDRSGGTIDVVNGLSFADGVTAAVKNWPYIDDSLRNLQIGNGNGRYTMMVKFRVGANGALRAAQRLDADLLYTDVVNPTVSGAALYGDPWYNSGSGGTFSLRYSTNNGATSDYATFEANTVLYKVDGTSWVAMRPTEGNLKSDEGKWLYTFLKTDPEKGYDVIIKTN